jgi:hypothetical protein
MDWLYKLEQSEGLNALESAFTRISKAESEYLEMRECSNAIAAGEVVAGLLGRPCSKIPDRVVAWMNGKPKPSGLLVELARSSIQTVVNSSELQEVWADAGNDEWLKTVADLQSRLSSV